MRRAWPWLVAALLAAAAWPAPTSTAATCERRSPGTGIQHPGRCDRGTRIRVTSVDRTRGHALLLVDGEVSPTRYCWRASRRDARPVIELTFATPVSLTGLALHRAPDDGALAPLDVQIDGWVGGDWRPLGAVRGDARAIARWTTEARDVDAVRLVLATPDVRSIRLTEVEVLGQPTGTP